MNRYLIIIFVVLITLVLGLIFGFPIEFPDAAMDRFSTIILEIIILLLFIQLFKFTRHINKKSIKWVATILISLVAIPYFLSGIIPTMLVTSSGYPMWQDMAVYTNSNGEKIISEWRRTSGSIYDYRARKIITEFGQIRISYEINESNIKGIWTKHLIENDSIFIVNLK